MADFTRSWRLPLAILAALTVAAGALSQTDRPAWDQAKAVQKVRQVLAVEQKGQPWDEIPWLRDPAEAARRAREEGKPILVFYYLKKNSGPPAAPC